MAYVSSVTTMRENPSLPECPECGGLQCLCRPRFFAGQLLTEEDLNRLDDYIVKKNRLHNRYLHGWGVVCGLDVVCNPCIDQSAQVTIKQVTVKAGYALSPCGEDIIVCDNQSLDIGKLIQACRQVQRQINCEPPWPTSSTECQEQTEDWVLALCYEEKLSRGITALKGSSTPCCCPRCGGSTSGCGCQENSTSKSAYQTSTRSVPAQCEPTLTCEGYSWRVYKAPSKTPPSVTRGTMVDRFLDCAKPLVAQLARLPGRLNGSTDTKKLYQFCCDFKKTLVEFLVNSGFYNSSVAEELVTVACLNSNGQYLDEAQWKVSVQTLVRLASEFLRHCLCAALLPPCPEPVYDDCVPLATITVQRTDNSIKNICTWDTRRFAVTLPNLSYWLSWLPLLRLPFELLQALCCEPLLEKGCELRLMVASDGHPEKEIIDKFKREFESKKRECAVLIVRASSDPNKWTIAGFDDAGEFKQFPINDSKLLEELKKEPINKSRIVELATSSLGRTRLEKRDFAQLNDKDSFPKAKFGDSQHPDEEFVKLFQELKDNSSRAIDMQNLILAILGAKAPDGQPSFVSKDEEFQNPLQFLLLNQLVEPLLNKVRPNTVQWACQTNNLRSG